MAKFIITGDWHIRGTNPRARLDVYYEALKRKINEVFSIAAKHKAWAVIVPGDIFDSPGVALGTIADLAFLLQGAPCKVLAIHGNHDIWGGNPSTKHRTPYGLLAKLNLIHDLTEKHMDSSLACGPENGWVITGHGFDIQTDIDMKQFCPPDLNEFKIHVVHSMLMDHSPGFEMRHTLISQVETTAQVIISGHEHIGFGIKRRDDGVLFINPGALCRLSAHHAEIERQVQVALLTVHENGECEAELIPLKCAAPGHEILSRAHLEAESERNERLERFLSLLASEGESKFLEVREIVEDIAAREQLPGEVKKEALRRIGEARERLGVG